MLVYIFIVFFSILIFYYLKGLLMKKKIIEGVDEEDDPNVPPKDKVTKSIDKLLNLVQKLITFSPATIPSLLNPSKILEGLTSDQNSCDAAQNTQTIQDLTNKVNNMQNTVNDLIPNVKNNTDEIKNLKNRSSLNN